MGGSSPEGYMKRRTKRLMGAVAITAGTLGAAGALLMRMKRPRRARRTRVNKVANAWARPGMSVTFRAEVKPGRDAAERTFRVAQLLPSGRVLLQGIAGEHAETEFEPVR
jgi:predicted SpoU family rRNA methylase